MPRNCSQYTVGIYEMNLPHDSYLALVKKCFLGTLLSSTFYNSSLQDDMYSSLVRRVEKEWVSITNG